MSASKWDDELNNILRAKGIDPSAEEITDPGLVPEPHINDLRFFAVMGRMPDSMDFHQLRCEFRNYVKAVNNEIEELKTREADYASELYRIEKRLAELNEALNELEPVLVPAVKWWRDERNIALAAVCALLVIMVWCGAR